MKAAPLDDRRFVRSSNAQFQVQLMVLGIELEDREHEFSFLVVQNEVLGFQFESAGTGAKLIQIHCAAELAADLFEEQLLPVRDLSGDLTQAGIERRFLSAASGRDPSVHVSK